MEKELQFTGDEVAYRVLQGTGKTAPRRSTLTTALVVTFVIVVVGILVIAAIAVAVGVTVSEDDSDTDSGGTVCLTPECEELSALLLSGMDENIDPCEDFYNFTCGSWVESNFDIIPDGAFGYGSFDILDAQNKKLLGDLLLGEEGNDIDAVVKTKDLYQSCLNTNVTNYLGTEPLLQVINMTGGWPLIGLPDVDGVPWDLNGEEFLQEKLFGSPALFTLSTFYDLEKTSRFILYVENSGLSLDSPYQYLFISETSALKTLIVTMLTALNSTVDPAIYDAAADEIIDLETKLAQIFEDVSDFDASSYNKFTLDELSQLWPAYNWVDNLQDLFGTVGISDIDGSEPIIVLTPNYFGNLSSVLQQANATVLENYAKWHLMLPFIQYLDDQCVAAYLAFKRSTSGSAAADRNEMCIEALVETLPIATGRLYAEYILPEGSMDIAAEMTTNIMLAFKERIDSRDWLDEPTKERARRKVELMDQMIAYPERIFDDAWLNELYAGYNFSPDNVFDNYFEVVVNMNMRMYGQLREPVDLWTIQPPLIQPTVVNAFYVASFNQMFILEGIMAIPFFNPEWPDSFYYGALGAVIGHEITHGFDNNGRLFNETGQMEDWWTPQSVQNFIDREQCYVEQYSQYGLFGINNGIEGIVFCPTSIRGLVEIIEGIDMLINKSIHEFIKPMKGHVDGNQTLGENIADNGAIAVGFQAYRSARERSFTLPGLNYTPDQLYFIAWSQLWCTYYTPRGYRNRVLDDEHSPGPFRVIGPLVNSPEFAEAFQCPEGSPMNPPLQEKCSLW